MKILVFSNDEMERSVIRQVMQHNGYEVITAGNSDEALQLLQKGEIRFVIVDRSTTDMDEKQFIKRLRDSHPSRYIYVLLIASRAQDMDITIPRGGTGAYLQIARAHQTRHLHQFQQRTGQPLRGEESQPGSS